MSPKSNPENGRDDATPRASTDAPACSDRESRSRAFFAQLHEIATKVHDAQSVEEALGIALHHVMRLIGFSDGQAFAVRLDRSAPLVPLDTQQFQHRPNAAEHIEARTRMPKRLEQEGLAQEAVSSGQPCWTPWTAVEAHHGESAKSSSVIAAAFPVRVNDRVEFVMRFSATHPIEHDESLQDGMENVCVHVSRAIERIRSGSTLRESERRFRELVESISQVFWVLDPHADELLYLSPEWSRIVGEPAPEPQSDPELWRRYIHPDDRGWVDDLFRTGAAKGDFDVVYRVVRADGRIRWIHDVAVPVQDEVGNVRRFLGVAEDVTERRELEREIADTATHEQQRLSRDLHDSIGQELTGLTMIASRLADSLEQSQHDAAATASAVVEGLKRTLQQVRRISRGLAPVDIDAGGLTVALAQLAEQTRLAATTECVFRCERPVTLRDPGTANHLYRIAQEAVANAVKHAQARTITIELNDRDGFVTLSVSDDGSGLTAARKRTVIDGMGLRIMRHRANLVGAQFSITDAESGGTKISCRLRRDDSK